MPRRNSIVVLRSHRERENASEKNRCATTYRCPEKSSPNDTIQEPTDVIKTPCVHGRIVKAPQLFRQEEKPGLERPSRATLTAAYSINHHRSSIFAPTLHPVWRQFRPNSPARIQVETPKIGLDRAKIDLEISKIDFVGAKIPTEIPKISLERLRSYPEPGHILSEPRKIDPETPKIRSERAETESGQGDLRSG
jgi:hypothetical protein